VLLGEKYSQAFNGVLRACDMEAFGKLITKETAPEIRKKLGAVFGSIVSIAVVKKCPASIATLFANILPEEKRTLLTSDNNIIYHAINHNNSEVISILISDLSPQDIRKALGVYFGYALREAVEKDMAELVNVLMKDITPDEWKEFVAYAFRDAIESGKKDLAIRLLGDLNGTQLKQALGEKYEWVLQNAKDKGMSDLLARLEGTTVVPA